MLIEKELLIKKLIEQSISIADVCRKLNICITNGNYITIKNIIKKYNIDITHFKRMSPSTSSKKISLDKILVNDSNYNTNKLKKRLFEEHYKDYKCEKCGLDNWMGSNIVLQLHHKDGDKWNNSIDNIEILCPNCHSMTDNYSGKNIKKNYKIDDPNENYISKIEKKYGINYEIILNNSKKLKSMIELSKKLNLSEKIIKHYLIKINKFNEIKNSMSLNKFTIKKEELESLIKEKSFCEIGRIYNISDNAIRKWCKKYNLPYRKKDIKIAG